MVQADEKWMSVLELIKNRISRPSFDTWLNQTKVKIEGNKWMIVAPNEFSRDWLEVRFLSEIKEAIFQTTKEIPEVVFITSEQGNNDNGSFYKIAKIVNDINSLTPLEKDKLFSTLKVPVAQGKENLTIKEAANSNLNSHYTFENFISSNGNRFSIAAAQSVALAPGKAYNPLFIYGEKGLGKTHLLQAIGNKVLKQNPSHIVINVNAEIFINEYIESLRTNTIKDFRFKYRNADLLLLDDVHFFEGVEETQDEFLHIFNQLYEKSKQIVITSKCHPKELNGMGELLKARFEWGLITCIDSIKDETHRNYHVDKMNTAQLLQNTESDTPLTDKRLLNHVEECEKLDRISFLEIELKDMQQDLLNLKKQVELIMEEDKEIG